MTPKDALTLNILNGTGTPSVGPIPPAITWAYTGDVTQYNYDPDRAQSVTRSGEISTWEDFLQQLNVELVRQEQTGGNGLRILTQTVTSPTSAAQLNTIGKKFPNSRWHQWEPYDHE